MSDITQETTLSCEAVSKSFQETPIVRDLDLRVQKGQIITLLGPSGCGKTTTLRLMAGFETLDQGCIKIAGRDVARANGRSHFHLPPEQRRIGMVFQDYAIFPHLSVMENVRFGIRRQKNSPKQAYELLDFVGLDGHGDKMPDELSGGQQQRVALARALAPDPDVLLLDEPFSNLDAALRVQVRKEVRRLLKEHGTTAIFVTHDQEEALFIGDHVAVMNEGHIEQIGPPEVIFHLPKTRFVAQFIGHADFVSGVVQEDGVLTSMGLVKQIVGSHTAGSHVEVVFRADDVGLVPDEAGNGRILNSQFVGTAYIYEIALADGSHVHSLQPHSQRLSDGTAVRLSILADHPLVTFPKAR